MVAKKMDGWKCKDCESLFVDEGDAKGCCGSDYDEEATYICSECGTKYDDEVEAADCCAAEECKIWECSGCEDRYDNEEEAETCCGDPNDW